jgi:crotonobetainyl-CoA:carnitine CoA-transferase CaiB-like acyl-CoA transferase
VRTWGFDYEQVRKLRPDIVYLSSQGLGAGPYGDYQTYGPNLQAFSGVTSLWAHPDDPFPVGSTINHPDHAAGKQALVAILAALRRREQTGEGCFIDAAQFEAAAAMIADKFLQHQLLPGTTCPGGNASPDFAPHGCYRCAGDERWCAIAVEDDAQWAALGRVVGEPWAADRRFATLAGRRAHAAEIDDSLSRWTRVRPAEDVERELRAAGVPVSIVMTGDDFAAAAPRHGDGLFTCVPHPEAGPRWYTGVPVRLPGGERYPLRRPPLLGEHDDYVLFDLLGLSPGEASALAASGAIGF